MYQLDCASEQAERAQLDDAAVRNCTSKLSTAASKPPAHQLSSPQLCRMSAPYSLSLTASAATRTCDSSSVAANGSARGDSTPAAYASCIRSQQHDEGKKSYQQALTPTCSRWSAGDAAATSAVVSVHSLVQWCGAATGHSGTVTDAAGTSSHQPAASNQNSHATDHQQHALLFSSACAPITLRACSACDARCVMLHWSALQRATSFRTASQCSSWLLLSVRVLVECNLKP